MRLISIYIVINILINQLKKIGLCLKLLWVKVTADSPKYIYEYLAKNYPGII